MADASKPVETPKEAPAADAPITSTEAPVETKAEEPKTEDKVDEAPAAEASTDAPAAEEKKEEPVVPVEEGPLDHKSSEAKLPKNFLYSKDTFWFGTDAVETDKLSSYVKSAKNVEVAQKNASWAASTGKGLLFVGPKDAPTGVINLAEASDVSVDGPVKFHFSASGFKHTFKAANKAEAENWVSQLNLKIKDAKAAKESVLETEAYKQAMEGFKPAKKEEKKEETAVAAAAEPAKDEAKTEEEAPKTEEAKPEEPAVEEAKTEESAKEEAKTEEEPPKRRSASRKRESFMGFFKKEKKEEAKPAEEKKEEAKPTETATETPADTAMESPAPAVTEPTPVDPAALTEDKPAEEPKEKPAVQKRGSIFSSFMQKKEKKSEEPAKEEAKTEEPAATSETAPVIPPVETTTPLDTGMPAGSMPTETTDVTPATNGEKKEMKSEKRKSSIPFFGAKEKSEVKPEPKSDSEEKTEKMSPFSKIRATIRGRTMKGSEKSEEKPAVEKTEDKPVETETAAEAPKEETPKPVEEEPVNKPEPAASTAPAVTAAA